MKNILLTLTVFLSFMVFTTGCEKVNGSDLNTNNTKENKKLKPTDELEVTAKVKMETNKGDFIIGLYGKAAPNTVKNFLSYVKEGYYNGLIFHRVIPGFVIQGGGFKPNMIKQETKAPIKLEIAKGLIHRKGILSMARTQVEDSATTQFFICLANVPSLDNKYAVFGELIKGIDTLDKIASVSTTRVGPYSNVPKEDVIILKATIIK
jgi:peptidyl-prolyl cis-trans isomerase A (cyclophilin A)